MIPLCTQGISVMLHFFWSWLFVLHFEMGIEGTAIAGIISNFTALTLNLICAYRLKDVRQAIVAPDAYMWHGIYDYLEIGIPCMLMVLLDGGAWHLMTFYLDLGLTGIWIAKVTIESFQAVCYTYLEASNRKKKEICGIFIKVNKISIWIAAEK